MSDTNGRLLRLELDSGRLTLAQVDFKLGRDIQLSSDGNYLAVGSQKNIAQIRDARSFLLLTTLAGYASNVRSVAFSRDSRRLATSGQGEEGMRLWDVENWEPVLALPVTAFLGNAAFSPDDNCLGALGEEGTLHLWRAPSWAEIEAAEKEGRWR